MSFLMKFGSSLIGSVSVVLAAHRASRKLCNAEDMKVKYDEDYKWDYDWDGLNGNPRSKDGDSCTHVLLIRHGQYDTRTEEKALTTLGREQARAAGRHLAVFCNELDAPLHQVFSSTMKRAKQTCDIALSSVPQSFRRPLPRRDPSFSECAPHSFSPPLRGYDPSPRQMADGQRQLDSAFKNSFRRPSGFSEDKIVVYFVHANVIRYLMLKFLQLPLNAWLRFNVKHCSYTHIILHSDGTVECAAFGDAGYMDPSLQSFRNL